MYRLAFVIAIVGLCHGGSARAEDTALTLEQTLKRVYLENPTILATRYGVEATKELYPQAAAGWKPKVGAESSMTSTGIDSSDYLSKEGATTKSASINIEQPLFRGFRTQSEMQAAESRISASSSDAQATEQNVFLNTVEAYMDVIRDRLLLALQYKNREILSKERESIGARFEAGDVTQTDVKQTEAKYSSALADVTFAESGLRASEAAFEKVTGIRPPELMMMPVVTFKFPETLDEMLSMAERQNPDLAGTRSLHDAANSDIRTAKSVFYPQVAAFASYIKEYDPQPGTISDSESTAVGVRARISLYEGGSTISRVREARNRANQRYIEIIESQKAIKSDLISSWRRYEALQSEIVARELQVTATIFSNEGVREEARLGERTVLDTLEAEQDVVDAQSALAEAKRNRIVTAYKLAAALGMLVPERMGLSGGTAHIPETLPVTLEQTKVW